MIVFVISYVFSFVLIIVNVECLVEMVKISVVMVSVNSSVFFSGVVMCVSCLCFYGMIVFSGSMMVMVIMKGVKVFLKKGGLIDSLWFYSILVISG